MVAGVLPGERGTVAHATGAEDLAEGAVEFGIVHGGLRVRMEGRGLQHLDDQRTVRRGAAQQFAQVLEIARAFGGAAEAAGDGEEVRV
uniref:Uncharacterized protein n=1 Tax=Pseudomonas aeruginosa TaxID=287 RepID=A0A5E5QX08_PSEAI|nr:hypothetical protein TUEID40_01196 [Pseudomonas aeruginosa]